MSFEMEMRQAVLYAHRNMSQGGPDSTKDEAEWRREGLALAKAGRLDNNGFVRTDPATDPAAAAMAMRMMDPYGFGGDPSLLEGVPDADVWTSRSGDVRDEYTDPRPALQRAIEAGQSTMSDLGPVEGGRAATATRGMEATFDAAMSPEFMAATILLPLAGGAVKMTRAAVLAKYPDLFAKASSLPAVRAVSEAEIAAMRTQLGPKIQKATLLKRHGYGEWADVKAIEAGDMATLRAMQDKGINISAADIATARQQARWNKARPREDHLWRAGPTDAAKESGRVAPPGWPETVEELMSARALAEAGVMMPGIGMAMRGRAAQALPSEASIWKMHSTGPARMSPAERAKIAEEYAVHMSKSPEARRWHAQRTGSTPVTAPTFTTSPVPMEYGGLTDPRLAKALAPPTGMALGAIKMFQEEQERMSDRDRTNDQLDTFRSAQAAIKRIRASGEELPARLQVADVDPERYYALTKMYGPAMGIQNIADGTAEWVMAGNKARYAPAEDWYAESMSGTQSIEKRQLQPRRMFPDPTTLEAVEAASGPERSFEDIEAELAAESERLRFPDPTTLDAVEAAPGPAKSFEELQREVEEEGRRLNRDEKLLREAAMEGGPMEGPMWTY